jgi:hypothetical protein
MSEEVASAFVERRAFEAAMAERDQWRDGYERVCDVLELRLDIDDCYQAASQYAGIVYDVVLGDLVEQNAALQAQLAASHEQIALLEAERTTWLRANSEVAALNIDLIVELTAAREVVAAAKKCRACLLSSPDMHGRMVALSSALKAYKDATKKEASYVDTTVQR